MVQSPDEAFERVLGFTYSGGLLYDPSRRYMGCNTDCGGGVTGMRECPATPPNWPGWAFRGYQFKLAESPDEIEQIHRLIYRTFVVEIKQHADSGDERLVDKFHHKNRYLVAVRRGQVCGMVAVHNQPPFSVSDAIPTHGFLERLGPGVLEVRLLTVEKRRTAGTLKSEIRLLPTGGKDQFSNEPCRLAVGTRLEPAGARRATLLILSRAASRRGSTSL
jgi:hypothetical protein